MLALSALTWRSASAYANEETLWGRGLESNPRSVLAHNGMGQVRMAQGRFNDAAAHFNEALRVDPNNVPTRLNLIACLQRAGRPDAALDELKVLAQQQPERSEWAGRMAELLLKNRRFAEAELSARIALMASPRDEGCAVTLGLAMLMQEKLAEARRQFETVLERNAKCVPAHMNLAVILARQGEIAAASEHLQEVIKIDPFNFDAYQNAGELLYKCGLYQEAETVCRSAVRLRPSSAEAFRRLANVLEAQGRHTEAKFCVQRAAELDPRMGITPS